MFQQGGVSERSNVPHLKCGMPQGIVSSNLTPSASVKIATFKSF
jgi:hypothetical protein